MIGFFYGLLQLMRIPEWSKSFGNMAIAAVTAGIALGVEIEPVRFLAGFAALALLWSGLYSLNDFTDRKADALHDVKKKRPIASGLVSPAAGLAFSLALILAGFAIAFSLESFLFLVCMAAMFINQVMYTMKPFSLKKRPALDLVSGSLVNPIFRFYSGWVLFVPAFNAPLLMLIFVVGLQFGGFGLYRMSSKTHEKGLGLRSSVVLFGEKNLRRLAYVSLAIAGLSYIIACFAILPISYLFLGIAMLLPAPLYKTALKRPQEMDMRRMYWTTYAHYMAFIAGFVILYPFQVL
ncbi:MAG: UbiA family prenyltransferase [Candidatus Diapherotrites archaeon]|uniref:UbiA family prenyltransferase n=1 Tax=Candidatus Iainarchaeum sp. TaxID=3101447 RepID=A0A939CAJ2_9ARCH|nr:UbiA family prenyltransferase [Candidatus Diapherotrites archaeon]